MREDACRTALLAASMDERWVRTEPRELARRLTVVDIDGTEPVEAVAARVAEHFDRFG